MKTIPMEQLGDRVSKAIEGQGEHEPIRLTSNAGTVAWLLRVPDSMKDTDANAVVFVEGPSGRIFVTIEAKQVREVSSDAGGGAPSFGAGKGTLTILSEDEDHLQDFQGYME